MCEAKVDIAQQPSTPVIEMSTVGPLRSPSSPPPCLRDDIAALVETLQGEPFVSGPYSYRTGTGNPTETTAHAGHARPTRRAEAIRSAHHVGHEARKRTRHCSDDWCFVRKGAVRGTGGMVSCLRTDSAGQHI